MEFKRIKIELELERLRLELEINRSEAGEANQAGVACSIFGETKFSDLPHLINEKDHVDSFLLRFEIYANVANCSQANWATQLSALLGGNALHVHFRLS